MATFSSNSVRHLYVANGYNTGATSANVGFVKSAKVVDGNLYLTYINTEGKEYKTDSIPVKNIRKATATKSSPKVLRQDTITFSALVPGETYILRFLIRQWGSGSAEDQYFKHIGSYKAKTGDTQETLVDALIANAAKSMAREAFPMFTFTKSGSGTSAKLVVKENEQPWVLGKQQGRNLDYTIQFVEITSGGATTTSWGTIASDAKPYMGVGTPKLTADMEYFYLGERGDIYRQVGFPYTWDTKYLTNLSAYGYTAIDIAYFTTEESHGYDKAEKQLTIMAIETQSGTPLTTDYTVVNAIIGAINTATGETTIATVS